MNKLLLLFLMWSGFTLSCRSQMIPMTDSLPKLKKVEADSAIINLLNSRLLDFNNNTEISVALVRNDTVFFYGGRNRDGEIINIDNQKSIFEIGSITKIFTAHLLTALVGREEISMEDSIASFKGKDIGAVGRVRLKQLATHSSGLPVMPPSFFETLSDTLNPYQHYTEEKMLYDLKHEVAIDEALVGQFSYSNYGMSLLGHLISEQQNLSYQHLLEREILTPVGMNHTTTIKDELKGALVKGFANGTPANSWDMNAISPAGGIRSNTSDLAKYICSIWSINKEVFEQQTQYSIKRNHRMDQSIGWMKLNSKSGNPYFFHSGRTGAYSSFLIIRPSARKGIILLSNISEDNNKIDNLGFKIMKTFMELR